MTTRKINSAKLEIRINRTFMNRLANRLSKKLITAIKTLVDGNRTEDDLFFDVKELARYLKTSPKWVYERTHLKEIPHLKVKGLLRFSKKAVDLWLKSHEVQQIQHVTLTRRKGRSSDCESDDVSGKPFKIKHFEGPVQ